MQATAKDLQALRELQEVDVSTVYARRKFDELPQRAQISELAKKKQAVLQKQAQVSQMNDAAQRKRVQIEDEVAILERKRDETQAKIDEVSGDYRAVQSLTRDLEGIAKRLSTLAEELTGAVEKEKQVLGVKAQIDQAVAALDAQAEQIRSEFAKQGGELQAIISQGESDHTRISALVDASVLKAYEAASKRGGGVGLAELQDGKCSVCRNTIDDNRLLIIKKEAPLSECPSCRRLLVIDS